MKIPLFFATLLVLPFNLSHGASAFWSFQNAAAGGTYNGSTTANPSNGTVTTNSGFVRTPSLTTIAGTGGALVGGVGGGVSFTDPSTGTTWEGNGTDTPSVGFNTQWGTTSAQNLTGAGFALALDTTGLADLTFRFDIRSATSSNSDNGRVGAATSFSTVSYRTDGGTWIPLSGVVMPTWTVQGGWQSGIQLDLSSFNFLENQANLELQFIFNSGAKVVDSPPIQNLRLDNLLVSAVPEPASLGLFGLSVALLGVRRRR